MTRPKTDRHPVLTTIKRELIERLQDRYPGRSLGGIVREVVADIEQLRAAEERIWA